MDLNFGPWVVDTQPQLLSIKQPDGTWQVVAEHATTIRYLDHNYRWQEIDLVDVAPSQPWGEFPSRKGKEE